jgi:glycerol-3-phosphate acyltransferase PlsX
LGAAVTESTDNSEPTPKSDFPLSASVPRSSKNAIILDCMGGDHGPDVVVQGGVCARNEQGIDLILVGDELRIRNALAAARAEEGEGLRIVHAPEEVTMEESPSVVLRRKPNCSIRRAFELLQAGEGRAVVSPANTGAVMAAGLFVLGTLPGITRPAIASVIPRVRAAGPAVLLDAGANTDCHAEQLVHFALMGSIYASSFIQNNRPRVALLSNGSESGKGNDLTRAASHLLSNVEEINFVGYAEGRDITQDIADVFVCDGFVGNIVLKTLEGAVDLVVSSIKESVRGKYISSFGMWLSKPALKRLFESKLDPSSYGGAPLLGLSELAIICHGSSSAKAISNAVSVAQRNCDSNLVERMRASLESLLFNRDEAVSSGLWQGIGEQLSKRRGIRVKK